MGDDQVLEAIEHDDGYRVVSVLAQGDRGTTELVMRGAQGPLVRKRIPAEISNREAWETLARIDDELLPTVTDIYELPDELVVVYEYVEGEPLAQMVARRGVLLPEEAVRIACDVARSAQHLHEHGLVHRDISPGNVIVGATGARLTDLGIARVPSAEASHDTTRLGTWGFAAPEQYGFAQTDARSDVWSLGRLLAYMLTGMTPGAPGFEGRLADERYVPRLLAEVIGWACAFEPSSRYNSAEDFRLAVVKAADSVPADPAGRGVAGKVASWAAPSVRPARQRMSPRQPGILSALAGELSSLRGANPIVEFREALPQTPRLRLVLFLPLWWLAATWFYLVVEKTYTTFVGKGPEEGPLYSLMGVFLFAGSYFAYLEIQRCMLRIRSYAGQSMLGRWLLLALALAVIFALTVAGMFVMAMIAAAVAMATGSLANS